MTVRIPRLPAVIAISIAALVAPALVPAAVSASPSPRVAAADDAPHLDPHPTSDYVEQAAQLPAALVDAVQRDLGKSGAEYLAEADAATDAVKVVGGLSDKGVTVLGSKMDGTTLVVNVATSSDVAKVKSVGGVAEIGEPSKPDLTGLSFSPTSDLYDGQGWSYTETGGAGFRCSIGFNGYNTSSGASQYASAGHCVSDMAAGSYATALTSSKPTNVGGTLTSAGTVGRAVNGSAQFGSGNDGGLVSVEQSGVVGKSSVLTWGGGGGAPLSSTPLAVTGMSAAIVGASLCKSGATTGWTCGTIQYVDYPLNVSGSQVNSILATTCVQGGDSGGSALIGQTAVAITSSSVTSPACGATNYFSGFFPLISGNGSASFTAQNPGWEPAVAVSSPIATSAIQGSGSIAGTLANASSTSAVTIWIDGAVTPQGTTSASDGTWAFTVPTGASSYKVQASWRTRSFSASTTAGFDPPGTPPVGSVSFSQPLGAVENMQALVNSVGIWGWTLDTDTTNPIAVHVYIDGSIAGAYTANNTRNDIQTQYNLGSDHGFAVTVPTTPGTHNICVYSINVGPGSNRTLGCWTATIGGSPQGSVDNLQLRPGGIGIWGWTVDPDTTDPIYVHVYSDNTMLGGILANQPNNTTTNTRPGYGANHGFGAVLQAAPGQHRICAYAINTGPGTVTTLGCYDVTIGGNPIGGIENAQPGTTGTVNIWGWAYDPDSADPISVHAYVDGYMRGGFPANLPTTNPAIPTEYGTQHRFQITIPTGTGTHNICLYALNLGYGNATTITCFTATLN